MSESLLVIAGLSEVQVTAEARHRRNVVLMEAADVEIVSTAEENETAAAVQVKLRDLRLETDKARKAVKAPLLALGKKIEAVADEYVGKVESEEQRIAKLCGDFLQLQLATARAAQAVSDADKLNLSELEKRRQQALAAASSHEERDAINTEFDLKVAEAQKAQQALMIPKAEGQTIKEDWEFTVLNALELANARPDLVEICPKRREIKEALRQGFRVPGIRAWKEVKAGVK